jgi:predicted RNA methylase
VVKKKGTTKAKGRKHQLDKFYTKKEVVEACLNTLDLNSYLRIIEPSAGAGAFSNFLKQNLNLSVLAFDVAPEHPNILKQDWFDYATNTPSPTLVVGNPPFGQQCSLALRFINHAFEVVGAQTVAFILPRSFRKSSVQSRIFSNSRLVKELEIGENSFELNGFDYNLNTVFQVWERTTKPRCKPELTFNSPYFSFTKKNKSHHFAIRRVGGKAGHAFVDSPETSEQSNYFIEVNDESKIDQIIDMINSIDFQVANDGTGPRTLSKPELVNLFNLTYEMSFPNVVR